MTIQRMEHVGIVAGWRTPRASAMYGTSPTSRARSALTSRRDCRERAGSGHELDVVELRDGVTLRACDRDTQIAAALGVPSDHGRAFGVRLVAVTPLHEREQDVHQLTALVRQAIFHACSAAGFAVLRSLENPLLDQQRQPLGQEVARALQDAVELLEPRGAIEALADDQQRPLLAKDLQGAGDRAVARLVVGALHRRARLAG